MKIRYTYGSGVEVDEKVYLAGQVYEVPDEGGAALCADGHFVEVSDDVVAVLPETVEEFEAAKETRRGRR